ncbi:hypothetical protein ACLI1A_11650 [Flavobacterium sp. RHBU_3]
MEEIEGLNEAEFRVLLDNVEALRIFMENENNRALLTPEQLATALAAIGE